VPIHISTIISASATRDQSQDHFISISPFDCALPDSVAQKLQQSWLNRATSQRPHKRNEGFWEKKMTGKLKDDFSCIVAPIALNPAGWQCEHTGAEAGLHAG